MRIDTEKDLSRERKAIETFVSRFNGSFKKLGPNDVDYRIFDKDNNLIAYAEVKSCYKNIATAYPVSISAKKLVKLCDKRLNPVIVWACDDGIIYGKPTHLNGEVKWGGKTFIEGVYSDQELMVYYDKQKEFRYIKYY